MYRLPLTVIDDCNLLEVRRIHSQRPSVLSGNTAQECCSVTGGKTAVGQRGKVYLSMLAKANL